MRSEIAKRILEKPRPDIPIKLEMPFWYNMLNWRQLHWLEMFLTSKHYPQNQWDVKLTDGKLIFYRDGVVRWISNEFDN